MPNYALGQQVSKTDDRIKATYETVPSPKGNGSIKGYLVRPVSADTRNAMPTKLPGIMVVHENRGLNPHIEDIARRFALANFMAFAPDGLTSLGGFPGDDYNGGQMFNKVNGDKMGEDFVAAAHVAEIARRLHGQDRRHRFLLRRRRRQYLGRPAGSRYCRRGAVLRRRSRPGHIPNIKAAILVHHGALDTRLAGTWPAYDMALNGGQRSARGLYLPRRRSRLQLRCHARTLQQSRGRPGVAAHDRLVQQIYTCVMGDGGPLARDTET